MAISESTVSEMRLAQSMIFVSNLFGFEIVFVAQAALLSMGFA
jgi:hypothetical protein